MSASRVLFDAPGPKARRRIAVVTVLSILVILAVAWWAVTIFASNGQLAAAKWKPFTNPGIPKFILTGLLNTMKVTVVAALVAFPLGALVCLMRLARNRFARWIATAYIEVLRSTPLLLLVYIFVGALPAIGFNVSLFWKITLPVILCNIALLAEVFRAGVRAVPTGQSEAALAVGLTYWQSMRLVVMPQAIRIIIPALITQFVSLLKDSSLGFAASYPELMKTATNLTPRYHNFIQSYLVIAAIYIVICLLLSTIARIVERRLARARRSAVGDSEDAQLDVVDQNLPNLVMR
jgi:glutamate transport system permease protein